MDIREQRPSIPVLYYSDENGDWEEELPTKKIVCPSCEGKGKCVNPSIDAHGISMEEFYEDPEFARDYMDGVYDITCPYCKGNNVVDEVDYDAMSEKEKKLWEEQERERHMDCVYEEAERRMGA